MFRGNEVPEIILVIIVTDIGNKYITERCLSPGIYL
jgi:hypothetical protein